MKRFAVTLFVVVGFACGQVGGGGASVFVNVKSAPYYAHGDGKHDDTAAIQSAMEAVSASGGTVYLPPGSYKITAPLTVSSAHRGNVWIRGAGRDFGTVLRPSGHSAFTFDGTGYPGGWVFRIKVSDMTIWPDSTSGIGTDKDVVSIKLGYNVVFENTWVNAAIAGKRAFYIRNSNDIVLRDVVAYGSQGGGDIGVYVDGSGGISSTVQIINPDIEHYYNGLKLEGAAIVSVQNPYVERCIVGLNHLADARGAVTVLGGMISSINGYAIGINSRFNLTVVGTRLDAYQGPSPGCCGVINNTNTRAENISLLGIPNANSDSTARFTVFPKDFNWSGITFTGSLAPVNGVRLTDTVLYNQKSLAKNLSSSVFEFAGSRTNPARIELVATGSYGKAAWAKRFTGVIQPGGVASKLTERETDASGQSFTLIPTLTWNAATSKWTLSVISPTNASAVTFKLLYFGDEAGGAMRAL